MSIELMQFYHSLPRLFLSNPYQVPTQIKGQTILQGHLKNFHLMPARR
jgi:hypothetical protein